MCKEYAVETFEQDGFVAEIHYDVDGYNPRIDNDPMGRIVSWHDRYDLGDKDQKQFKTRGMWLWHLLDQVGATEYTVAKMKNQDVEIFMYDLCGDDQECTMAAFKALEGHVLILPVYLYDHGNLWLKCSPFACPWDSGTMGYIYMTAKEIKNEYGKDAGAWDKARKYLVGEIEDYNLYVSGQCYCYVVKDAQGKTVDSCGGFLGMEDVTAEAKSSLDFYAKAGKQAADAAKEYGYA